MMIRQVDCRRPLDEVQNIHLLVCLSFLWFRSSLGVGKVAKHEKSPGAFRVPQMNSQWPAGILPSPTAAASQTPSQTFKRL